MPLKNERDELKKKLNELSISSTMEMHPREQGQPNNCMPFDISSPATGSGGGDILVMDSILEKDHECDPLARMDMLLLQLQVRCTQSMKHYPVPLLKHALPVLCAIIFTFELCLSLPSKPHLLVLIASAVQPCP